MCYVVKEYNLHRHFDTKHYTKRMLNLVSKKNSIVQELKGKLQLQQGIFTKATAKNGAILEASFIVAEDIAEVSLCFSEGEFLKCTVL